MNTNKLKKLLKTRKLTYSDIAKEINFSATAFGQALRRGDFKASQLKGIAKYLEVPITFIFNTHNFLN